MRLYHLYRKGGYRGLDNLQQLVVRAPTSKAARKIAAMCCGGEGPDLWMDAKQSTCKRLTDEGTPGPICVDFYGV